MPRKVVGGVLTACWISLAKPWLMALAFLRLKRKTSVERQPCRPAPTTKFAGGEAAAVRFGSVVSFGVVGEAVAGCRRRCCGFVGLAADGGAASVAFGVHLEDCGVMDEAVDGGDGDGLVREDAFPGAEWLVAMARLRCS
jgi:hypothetical protein